MIEIDKFIQDIFDKNGFPNVTIQMDLNLPWSLAWYMIKDDCYKFEQTSKLISLLERNFKEIEEVFENSQEEMKDHYKNYSDEDAKLDAVKTWERVLKYVQQSNPVPKNPIPITKVKVSVLSDNPHLKNLKFMCSYCEHVKFPLDTADDNICKSKCIGVKYGVFGLDKNDNAYLCTHKKSLYMKLQSCKNKSEYVETVQTLLNNMKGVLSNGKLNDRTKQSRKSE